VILLHDIGVMHGAPMPMMQHMASGGKLEDSTGSTAASGQWDIDLIY
jgi:hypothetical protein